MGLPEPDWQTPAVRVKNTFLNIAEDTEDVLCRGPLRRCASSGPGIGRRRSSVLASNIISSIRRSSRLISGSIQRPLPEPRKSNPSMPLVRRARLDLQVETISSASDFSDSDGEGKMMRRCNTLPEGISLATSAADSFPLGQRGSLFGNATGGQAWPSTPSLFTPMACSRVSSLFQSPSATVGKDPEIARFVSPVTRGQPSDPHSLGQTTKSPESFEGGSECNWAIPRPFTCWDIPAPPRVTASQPKRPGESKGRLWCHLYVNSEMVRGGFDLNKRIIGPRGSYTRNIFEATSAKIRLRGRGSGHHEMNGKEAPAPLMLAITGVTGQPDKFVAACRMAIDLLSKIERDFQSFICGSADRGPIPTGRLYCIGNISPSAKASVQTMLTELNLSCPEATNQPEKHSKGVALARLFESSHTGFQPEDECGSWAPMFPPELSVPGVGEGSSILDPSSSLAPWRPQRQNPYESRYYGSPPAYPVSTSARARLPSWTIPPAPLFSGPPFCQPPFLDADCPRRDELPPGSLDAPGAEPVWLKEPQLLDYTSPSLTHVALREGFEL